MTNHTNDEEKKILNHLEDYNNTQQSIVFVIYNLCEDDGVLFVCVKQTNPYCFWYNRFTIYKPNNCQLDEVDLHTSLMRDTIIERQLDNTNTTVSLRTIYNNKIIL